jgi:hypothetical protein
MIDRATNHVHGNEQETEKETKTKDEGTTSVNDES